MKVMFSDGASAWRDGRYRLIRLDDGWYVVRQGYLCQVDTKEEGMALIKKLSDAKEGDDSGDAESVR